MPATVQIDVQGLVKTFELPTGRLRALDGVTFRVREGEFFCIVGPSGCGKTTILRILAGLETASGGEVAIYGRNGRRPRAAMVFQEQSVFPWMTVCDNVTFALRSLPLSAADCRRVVDRHLDQVGLLPFAAAYPHQLSGGMRQRVSIARALATGPEILLMDEPFAALDEQNRLLLQEELVRLWETARQTVIYITHSIDEAVALGDQVMVMTASPGRVKAILPVPLGRPRDIQELRRDPTFGECVHEIWAMLRSEVLQARGLAAAPPARR